MVRMRGEALSSRGLVWGVTEEERRRSYPCDDHLADFDQAMFRGIDVAASSAATFRWLCQLRAAPYSYDWIDNFGRRSPRELTDGLERLEPGQRFMSIFRLVEFDPGRSITLRHRGGLFGDVVVTYAAEPEPAGASRLLVKMLVRYPGGLRRRPMSVVLPWGDLVMMRKQLLTLKELAERDGGS
jgi:hypothetical protein